METGVSQLSQRLLGRFLGTGKKNLPKHFGSSPLLVSKMASSREIMLTSQGGWKRYTDLQCSNTFYIFLVNGGVYGIDNPWYWSRDDWNFPSSFYTATIKRENNQHISTIELLRSNFSDISWMFFNSTNIKSQRVGRLARRGRSCWSDVQYRQIKFDTPTPGRCSREVYFFFVCFHNVI